MADLSKLPPPPAGYTVTDQLPPPPAGYTVEASPRSSQPDFKEPEGSAVSRFAKGAWDTTVGGILSSAKLLANAALRPSSPETMEAINGLIHAHVDQAQKMKESWNAGNYSEAFGHGLATALPAIGPAAAHAGERIGGAPPEFDRFGNVTKQGEASDIAGALGEGSGLVASSMPETIAAPVARGVAKVGGKLVPERVTPTGMYQSALRPGLSQKNIPKIKSEVATGLREEIPVSRKGLETTQGRIEDINQEIADKIATKSDELGPVINPLDVTKPVNRLRPTFAEQVNPEPDIAAINSSKAQFLKKHTLEAPYTKIAPGLDEPGFVPVGEGVTKTKQPLTLSEAQAEKQGTYRQLRKKYGELGSADVEAQKALAKGLKDEIAKRVPEITALNARDSALIDLNTQLERMVAREGNKNLLGLVPATMAHNPFGFLATLALDNPAIKSRLAIALNRARQSRPSATNVGRTAPAAIAGAVMDEQQNPLENYMPPRLGPPR